MKQLFFWLVCFCYLHIVSSAQTLQAFIEDKQQMPVLQSAVWGGIAAYTQQPFTPVFAFNESVRLTPASTLKLLTTAAALETFGPDYRFKTNLYAAASPDENGILHGDLYLQGGGDPTLGSTRVTGAEKWQSVIKQWVSAIQKAGIKQINGSILADVSLFDGPSIAPKVNWENMGNYYAAPASPLCFNDNSFEIHFAPQPLPDHPTQVDSTSPDVPGLNIQNFVTTDGKSDKDNAYVYAAPQQYELKIFGTIPTNLTGFNIKGALPDPALFAAQTLQTALEEKGIKVARPAQTISAAPDYTNMPLLHTYQSPKLKDIVLIVNKRSFNLYADMLLRMLAVRAGKSGSLQNGLDELKNFLQRNNITTENDTVLHDGSGLARDNLITPQVLLNTLIYMSNSPYFKEYYQSLATPDDRGDLLVLRRFLRPLKRIEQVRVKGGTIDSVKAAAGYVKDRDGQLIAFVMIANNLAGKDENLWRFHEDVLKKLISLPEKN